MNAAALVIVAKLLVGGAAGLAVHESGHVLTGAMFHAHPGTTRISYAGIPFFAVTHTEVSRRKEFVISSAGLWMQHAGSEWILTSHPNLRRESSPVLKGILAFNTATSVVYTVAGLATTGPLERDTRGMASSLGRHGWPEPTVGLMVLTPAALDVYRYFHPDARWATWASRGTKAALMGLVLFAGRPVP